MLYFLLSLNHNELDFIQNGIKYIFSGTSIKLNFLMKVLKLLLINLVFLRIR